MRDVTVNCASAEEQRGTHLPQTALFEVLFELLILEQDCLHAVPQLTHFSLQHELVLPSAAHLLLHSLQLHLDVLRGRTSFVYYKATTK